MSIEWMSCIHADQLKFFSLSWGLCRSGLTCISNADGISELVKRDKLQHTLSTLWRTHLSFYDWSLAVCLGESISFPGTGMGTRGSRPGICECIPVTPFGILYRLESLQQHHQNTFSWFSNSPDSCCHVLFLFPVHCQAWRTKASQPQSSQMLTAVPSHGESLENGKQDAKDPENAREGSLVSQPVTSQAVIVETPCLPESWSV